MNNIFPYFKRQSVLVLLVAAIITTCPFFLSGSDLKRAAFAAEIGEREWKDASGKFKTKAILVGHDQSTVALRKSNNRVVKFPLEKLSEEDRAYIAALDADPMYWVKDEMKQIAQLEDDENWEEALTRYERLYETGALEQATLIELRKKFEELRPKVGKNKAPSKANRWRVKAFVIKKLDFTWKDKDGTLRRCRASYAKDEINRIKRCMKGFADFVWEFSDGWVKIDWSLEVVDATLTRLSPIGETFWVGPEDAMTVLPSIKPYSAETIMVFVKTADFEKYPQNDSIPLFSFGAALGVSDPDTCGATYISFNWETNSVLDEPDGEAMLHEWLHSVQWALEERQGWPKGLAGNPDGGRMANEERDSEGADPCYRRDPEKEESWIMFYKHILQTHTTRKMLRDLSLKPVSPTVND